MRRVALAILCLAGSASAAKPPRVQTFDSAAAAMRSLLPLSPRVIGFGEYHAIEGGPKVTSAIKRFTDEILPVVGPGASDLVLETWVMEGRCGKKEKQVVTKVQEETKRPEETEDELVTLIKHSQSLGVRPHVLTVTCVEYLYISDGKGGVDYVRLLATITDHLKTEIGDALDAHKKDKPQKAVLVYGGALHNDLRPRPELADYTYAPSVKKRVKGRFLEVDLYVPEFVEHEEDVTSESWWPEVAKLEKGKVALVRRAADSYVIVYARSDVKAAPSNGAAPSVARDGAAASPDGGVTNPDGGTKK